MLRLLALALLLAAGPASAQSGTVARPQQYQCIDQNGNAALCQFSDVPSADVAPSFKPALPEKRALVVTISPNSGSANPYPANATPVVAAATGTTGAVTATMAASTVGQTNYICGVIVSAIGGTATIGPITISNLIGNITFTLQLASTASGNTLNQSFSPCIPAKATNTAIAVATTADGTATAVDVNAWGYLQ